MVHRKSEYRLSYRWLPQHLCQVTRESLADYRVRRRRTDLDHQSWSWDPVAACECDRDGDNEAEAEESDRHLPVPENRAKHNALLEQWRMERFRPSFPVPVAASRARYDYNRPVWEAGPLTSRPAPDDRANGPAEGDAGNYQRRLSLRDHPAGMPTRDGDDLDRRYPDGERWATEVGSPAVVSCRDHTPPTDDIGSGREFPRAALTPRSVGVRDRFQPTIAGYRSRTHRSLSAEPRRRKMDIAPTDPVDRIVLASKGKIIPTVKFKSDPSADDATSFPLHGPTHLTNTVRTCPQQVSPAATVSLKFKDSIFPKEHYAKNLSRSKRWPTHSTAPVNHSSLWMTEYSRNYTRAMRG